MPNEISWQSIELMAGETRRKLAEATPKTKATLEAGQRIELMAGEM